jgi:hypothetical protein
MEPRDDIEFDFFDEEPATGETQSRPRVRLPGGPGRRSRGPIGPPRGAVPLLRLGALVVFVIFLVLVFALLVQSCASSSKHDSYAAYMAKVDKIAAESTAHGKAVATTLATPGLKVDAIEAKLRGIADQERQNVKAASNFDPPGRLRDENTYLIEALQLRVSGIDGLADTFHTTASSTNTSSDANLLAEQADRLLASDVVWADLFKTLAVRQLQKDGISGVSVPDSQTITKELVTPHSMALVLQRIRGASTGGAVTGLHGTNIVAVKALPSGQTLSAGTLNTVTTGTELAFQVTIEDSGDSQEVQIPITLTIDRSAQSGGAIVKKQMVQLINPMEQKTVTFTDLGQVPFATQTTLKVDVKGVPGEVNKANNSAEYPVIFSLPG